MDIERYYRQPQIRDRMLEFLGGPPVERATAVFLTSCDDPAAGRGPDFRSVTRLDEFLTEGREVCRSLWERDALLAHLDLEYVNFDFPAEAYLDPERAFSLQQPAALAAWEALRRCGIKPLHVLSGRGHHLIWRIPLASAAGRRLAALGKMPAHLVQYYAAFSGPDGDRIGPEMGAAFAALGLVMEYLAYRIKAAAGPAGPLPVELTAVNVPEQERGREMISVDISEYGDPLNTRIIRTPFSVYLKPWRINGILHEEIRSAVPVMIMIPLADLSLEQGLRIMRDEYQTLHWATRVTADIPDCAAGTEALLEEYLESQLAAFHAWYYSLEHDPPERWSQTYDRLSLERLPEIVRGILSRPNDDLLKPAGIREVVRALLLEGWHPRHIAGLIRSKYERNFGWGGQWYFYDAATRADFYTRMFAGLEEVWHAA